MDVLTLGPVFLRVEKVPWADKERVAVDGRREGRTEEEGRRGEDKPGMCRGSRVTPDRRNIVCLGGGGGGLVAVRSNQGRVAFSPALPVALSPVEVHFIGWPIINSIILS